MSGLARGRKPIVINISYRQARWKPRTSRKMPKKNKEAISKNVEEMANEYKASDQFPMI